MKLQLEPSEVVEINGIKFVGSFFANLCKELEKGDPFRFVKRQDGLLYIENVDQAEQGKKAIDAKMEWRNNFFWELGKFCHSFNIDQFDGLCPVKPDSEVFKYWQQGWDFAETTRQLDEALEGK